MKQDRARGPIAIVYHYVRPVDDPRLRVSHLDVAEFRKQIEVFGNEFGFIKRDEWDRFALEGGDQPDGVILTFDDGLIDHYQHVLPVLNEFKIWGHFFVCTGPLRSKSPLHVHIIHHLLRKYSPGAVFNELVLVLETLGLNNVLHELSAISAYSAQSLDVRAATVKKLNYYQDAKKRDLILHELLERFSQSPDQVLNETYMTTENVKTISSHGNIVGAHSETHPLLTTLDDARLKAETATSISYLEGVVGAPVSSFCFPYGGDNSYDDRVIAAINNVGIKYAFRVGKGTAAHGLFDIPRQDCNLFLPSGYARGR